MSPPAPCTCTCTPSLRCPVPARPVPNHPVLAGWHLLPSIHHPSIHPSIHIQMVHRDLKLENVLLHKDPATGQLNAKLADFGLVVVGSAGSRDRGHGGMSTMGAKGAR